MQRKARAPASPYRRPVRARLRVLGRTLRLYGAVALGTAIGGLLRALVSFAAFELAPGFPWGTLIVNALGSLMIGFYATLTGPDGRLIASSRRRHFVMTGICGGFTTFSVFSLDTVHLVEVRAVGAASLYLGLSVATWLGAVWLGYLLAARINGPKGR